MPSIHKRESPRAKRSIRAREVLPPELLAQVQEHAQACFLYVPSVTSVLRAARNARIINARAEGATLRLIADEFGITERRVFQILAAGRRRQAGAT